VTGGTDRAVEVVGFRQQAIGGQGIATGVGEALRSGGPDWPETPGGLPVPAAPLYALRQRQGPDPPASEAGAVVTHSVRYRS
jgi:hypothetical protein